MKDVILELDSVSKSFDGEKIIDNLNLEIQRNEFITLLGPSGCGKSTTLRIIGGFVKPDEGRVLFEGREITGLSPDKRNVNTVFQKYSLFPHMTVAENIAFGLRLKKKSQQYIKDKIEYALKLVNMDGYGSQSPNVLSGGQQQRVAIARAIVNEPKILLLDEPLGALDLKLRHSMQRELIKIKQEVGITFVYVTHDQVEAMTMADRIVIMKDGVIQQAGAPMELYEHPVNKFVAGFIGSPQMNFYPVTIHGKELRFRDGSMILLPDEVTARLQGRNGELIMGIRGEDLKLDAESVKQYNDSIQRAVVENAEVMGNENNLYFTFGGSLTVARVSKYEVSRIGDNIAFVFLPGKMHFFDKDTENAIG